ncbi:MAG: hypothetical protein IKQ77_16825 [Prevotella sp.]|nr:hypothetical protein [Prevotella sp.]
MEITVHNNYGQIVESNFGTLNNQVGAENENNRCVTKTEEEIKDAVIRLMDEKDVEGHYLLHDQEQWWAVKMVLTSVCGFPMKPADFGRVVKNLELDDLRVRYDYESVRKVHAHQLPNKVELWHNYQNTADEYSRKQVVVATRLMELLKE